MNILLIEDNIKMAENIKTVLCHEGYNVTHHEMGQKGFSEACINNYNLIILDLTLPDIDGIEVCQKLRKNKCITPILMLTARIDIDSKVDGLDSGADDYLTKPFLMDELLARIRSLIRRDSKNKSSLIQLVGNISINLASKQVLKSNLEVKLSPIQYNILELLAVNQGKNMSQLEIYELVWGTDNSEVLISDTLKVHIATIRKKLGKNIIKTVRDQGYMIDIDILNL